MDELNEDDNKENENDESITDESVSSADLELSLDSKYVIDGGALLHRIEWHGAVFADLVRNIKELLKKYGPCTIVFDGYLNPSTNDHEHRRRKQNQKRMAADMKVDLSTEIQYSRKEFFANEQNKVVFIDLLADALSQDHKVVRCKGDADTHIVKEALVFAYEGRSVIIVADDTGVLILLMYQWDPSMANIFMRSEPKKKSLLKIVNIEKCQ